MTIDEIKQALSEAQEICKKQRICDDCPLFVEQQKCFINDPEHERICMVKLKDDGEA